MRSSTAFSMLLFLAGTEALPQRSTHDSLLVRNFKNVLSGEEKAALAKRDPQGPASNPGEFTNVGLSNSNPNNFVPQMGGDGNSQSATITASATLSSASQTSSSSINYFSFSYGDGGPGFQSAFPVLPAPDPDGSNGVPDPMDLPSSTPSSSMTSSRHHHHTGSDPPRTTGHHVRPCKSGVSGVSCLPEPTGHHRHHNGTGRAHQRLHEGEAFVETEADMGPGDVVTLHETLWQYDGTGWNHTDIPLPSGTITMLPVPPSTASGAGGTGTGTPVMDMNGGAVPIDNGFGGPAFMDNAPRPGFVGPRDEGSNEGAGIMKEKRAWLSGIF